MTTVKIPLKETILEKINGKTIIGGNINLNGELELEVEECGLYDRLDELNKEIDDGKGIKVDADNLEKHFL